ncbi:DUF6630 family protein [Chryseosolibacter indicus]|uniref:DUF6630 domain-containing protein n=1 Tax=Chryseosolibacter indicus TaxID=2782351 RepID=A0ABS5VYQ2_9BACT|nr:hypothetical protein [Chryseosolibacter indicus]MBT1706528.1 hypothetical protein [Chryseosolibacter indicus]
MKINIEAQKEGYLKLVELCVGESKRHNLVDFIKSLKDYNGDVNYVTTLNYVKDYLDRNSIHFIMALDWKQGIDDLVWRVKSALRDNFDLAIELPNPAVYGERASVSYKNVFKDFDSALKLQNFKIGFIDTDADEYVIIIHKAIDEKEIVEAVQKIGYIYLDSHSPKINNEN